MKTEITIRPFSSLIMKKFLITIAPLCVVLFALMWISWGLKGIFVFFGVGFFITAILILFDMWVEFVDKHIKD